MRTLTASEDDIHHLIADALEVAIAPPGVPSMRGVMWESVEMRTSSKRDRCERAKRGVVAGHPDISVYHGGRYFGIELKKPNGGKPNKAQRDRAVALRECGCEYAICVDLPQVMAALELWQIPHRRVG